MMSWWGCLRKKGIVSSHEKCCLDTWGVFIPCPRALVIVHTTTNKLKWIIVICGEKGVILVYTVVMIGSLCTLETFSNYHDHSIRSNYLIDCFLCIMVAITMAIILDWITQVTIFKWLFLCMKTLSNCFLCMVILSDCFIYIMTLSDCFFWIMTLSYCFFCVMNLRTVSSV